ncbi:MAG: hypothetical protein AAGA77_02470 [Bacteroidota bacterium]
MKTVVMAFCFFGISLLLNSQSINFEAPMMITEHPLGTNAGTFRPFIPFDCNQDGITDFSGTTSSDQLVLKGNSDGSFETIGLSISNNEALIKRVDWDDDGDEDIVFRYRILISEPNDEFSIIDPEISSSETIADVADLNQDSHMDFVTINRIFFEDHEIII